MEVIIPKIKVNKKIFIPMVDTIMTRENIDMLPKYSSTVELDDETNKRLR
jgi:hypothetical protein